GEQEAPVPPPEDELKQRRVAALTAVAPPPPAEPAAPVEEAAPAVEPATSTAVAMVDANVRERPTTSSDRVARIRKGDAVRVTGGRVAGNWYPIETGDGVAGFIYSDLIEVREASGGAASPSATTPAELSAAVTPAESPPPQQQQQQVAALAVPQDRAVGGAFRDCEDCPALVRLPASTFVMGSGRGDPSERPPHRVSLSRAFAIGKHEVTTAEWNACVEAGGCRYDPDIPGLTDASPVSNVSWQDAQDYVTWLSATTGRRYRLPTEAEWEYAARGGTATSYWWGDDVGQGNANCADCGGSWDRAAPAAVGSFRPNPFGLGEMNGGVAEWVADCWFASHEGAPGDGSAREGPAGSCTKRVLRGGSWRNDRSYLTSASRLSYDANVRYYTNGFRVARDLN
ncbi:MAG TPA: SUMF1/EgtB/PvdO family nonheme iron enzyme, partial [Geminicoccaceae bacterium]|nr:SUMF1/EgtB/PvdO family nonheme iron enzyme [Geminicoccaceae bacterium]